VSVLRQGRELCDLAMPCARGAHVIPEGRLMGANDHIAALSGRRRGVCTCVAVAVNNQFLVSFLKSDLREQKCVSKTCTTIH